MRVICTKLNCQPHGFILICQNQSQEVKTMVLKWVITKSWISNFENFQTSLQRWHILLQHQQNTYHITTVTITAQTGHLPSNMSSPRFSSEVPWWKYFPENPKLNRKPGTSCWIRCCVAKIACRHKESIQITSLQTLNTHWLMARDVPASPSKNSDGPKLL
jgi:hypothetical protein